MMLTTMESAKITGIKLNLLRRLVKNEKIDGAIKLSRDWLIPVQTVEKILLDQERDFLQRKELLDLLKTRGLKS